MLRHIVLVRSAARAEVQRILDTLPALAGQVPGLVRVVVADNAGPHHRGYDKLFVLDFADAGSLAAWDSHPAHIPIRDGLLRLSDMIVADYPVPGEA